MCILWLSDSEVLALCCLIPLLARYLFQRRPQSGQNSPAACGMRRRAFEASGVRDPRGKPQPSMWGVLPMYLRQIAKAAFFEDPRSVQQFFRVLTLLGTLHLGQWMRKPSRVKAETSRDSRLHGPFRCPRPRKRFLLGSCNKLCRWLVLKTAALRIPS